MTAAVYIYIFILFIWYVIQQEKKIHIINANAKARHHHYISVLGVHRVEAQQIHSNHHTCAALSQVLVVSMKKRMIVMWTE